MLVTCSSSLFFPGSFLPSLQVAQCPSNDERCVLLLGGAKERLMWKPTNQSQEFACSGELANDCKQWWNVAKYIVHLLQIWHIYWILCVLWCFIIYPSSRQWGPGVNVSCPQQLTIDWQLFYNILFISFSCNEIFSLFQVFTWRPAAFPFNYFSNSNLLKKFYDLV